MKIFNITLPGDRHLLGRFPILFGNLGKRLSKSLDSRFSAPEIPICFLIVSCSVEPLLRFSVSLDVKKCAQPVG